MNDTPLNISPEDLTGSNPRAASMRLKAKSLSQAYGQRRHDLRIGPQPKYVDPNRQHLNRILISPRPLPEIRRDVIALRKQAGAKRAMKSNAAVVTAGIITFGHEAQKLFLDLSLDQQDAAFRELAQAIADRLGTSLEALTVHCDESAIHAHLELRALTHAGVPLSKSTRPTVMGQLQDLVFEVMSRHCPGIERGNRKYDRLAAGADYAETVNKSVRQLHNDLPLEIEALEQKRDALQSGLPELAARVEEMQGRVTKLEAEAAERELTAAKVKRLRVYRDRLSDRVRDLEARQGEVENLEDRAEIAKRARIHAEKGRRSALEGAQKAESRISAVEVREAQLEASEAALRVSEAELDSREKRLEHREGLVIGLAQAIRGVLEEASEWLGDAIPTTIQGALPALRMALDKFKIRQEQDAASPEDDPGGPAMEM
jgi:hypothetical protein